MDSWYIRSSTALGEQRFRIAYLYNMREASTSLLNSRQLYEMRGITPLFRYRLRAHIDTYEPNLNNLHDLWRGIGRFNNEQAAG